MVATFTRTTHYDRTDPRRPVNLSLNADLLGDYLHAAREKHEDEQRQLDSVIDAVKALHTRDGLLSDEFSTL